MVTAVSIVYRFRAVAAAVSVLVFVMPRHVILLTDAHEAPAYELIEALRLAGLQTLFRGLAEMVNTGSITIHFGQTGPHLVEDRRRNRRSCVVVEVEMLHLISV